MLPPTTHDARKARYTQARDTRQQPSEHAAYTVDIIEKSESQISQTSSQNVIHIEPHQSNTQNLNKKKANKTDNDFPYRTTFDIETPLSSSLALVYKENRYCMTIQASSIHTSSSSTPENN